MSTDQGQGHVFSALDSFAIEIPSWGFANTGTRFGKFAQAAAATTIEEKFADAAEVHRLTGVTPTLALHVLWDLPNGVDDTGKIKALEAKTGVRAGSINPNLFQEPEYKFGSICNPSAEIREKAMAHLLDSVEIGKALGAAEVTVWLADGSNYPGTQSMRRRIGWMKEALARMHAALAPGQTMLLEYKPFEPAFYHTDIADWGMALELARRAGPKAKVLVYRASSSGDEHRADRDLAVALRCAGRLPLQRPQVRGRRPDARLHRPVPGLPHLPRDSQLPRPGCDRRHRLHDRPEPQSEG